MMCMGQKTIKSNQVYLIKNQAELLEIKTII